MKKVFIIHRWDGNPESDFYPWLKNELEKNNFEVIIPNMPESSEPKIKKWVSYLNKIVKNVDKDTYFVGHSIGCQTILRYLGKIGGKIGGCVFVAGWFSLTNLETEEEKEIAKPWLETPINFEKVKSKTKNFIAIFSDDDPFVPLKNANIYKEKLGAKIIIEKNQGHFNINKVESVLKSLLSFSKQQE